jgi:DNA replication protein DnaC
MPVNSAARIGSGSLVDREATSRENKRLARRLREARLRQSAVVEDVDFRAHRGLDRGLFLKLATRQWIREHHHLALVGPTGIGKSWLACALGHKACREGFSVLYKRASRLFIDLAQARGEGRLPGSSRSADLLRCPQAEPKLRKSRREIGRSLNICCAPA